MMPSARRCSRERSTRFISPTTRRDLRPLVVAEVADLEGLVGMDGLDLP
jgi:hypothetical protein